MAIQIKDVGTLGAKFVARAQAAVADYKAGVASPRRPQAASAIAAKDTWAQGVQAAAANGSFAKGLQKSGDAKWQANATNKGGVRYGPGVAAAQNDWQNGVAPYLQTLSNLTLPARGVRGSPQNIQRVQAVADALSKLRMQSQGQ
jgi:hypothetical protein